MKRSVLLLIALLYSPFAHGIVDENANGLSDLWEKTYNNDTLFPSTFLGDADPDADGWTNAQEAEAGTDPLDANPPVGHFTPDIEITPATYWDPDNDAIPDIDTPEVASLTWPTRPGTLYLLEYSTALAPGTWLDAEEYHLQGDSPGEVTCHITLTQANGQKAEKLFWRVTVKAADSDQDKLTNAEEFQLGTNPSDAYTDSDLLSDYQEVVRYQSNPANSDSDTDGSLDDDDPDTYAAASSGTGTESLNTYAPTLRWLYSERSVHYNHSENFPIIGEPRKAQFGSWSNFKAPFYDHYFNAWASVEALPLSGLLSTLRSDFPYPADGAIAPEHVAGQSISSTSASISNSIYEINYLIHTEAQIKLMSTEVAETEIKKQVMVMNWVYPYEPGSYPPPTSIEAKEFTIAPGGRISAPQTVDEDFVAGGAYHSVIRRFYTPEFAQVGDEDKGWDTTGNDLWRGLAVDETTFVRLDGFFNQHQAATDLLEIAAIEGGGNITLTGQTLPLSDNTFQIQGVSTTAKEGARIVLRLKASPNTIFASMRVHVFEKQEVPVTIYRIYDSRQPDTEFSDGPTNAEILAKLNETYLTQGNIHFYDNGASSTYDIGYDKSKEHPTPNVYFFDENDELDNFYTGEIRRQTRKGIYGMPAPAKLIIHIAKSLEQPPPSSNSNAETIRLGFTPDFDSDYTGRDCFVALSSPILVFPHEVGHAMEISTKGVGQIGKHDRGAWPSSFDLKDAVLTNKCGLMCDHYNAGMTMWIRREDWWNAYNEVKKLK